MTHQNRYDFSGRAIGPSQRPLPDKTHHSKQSDISTHDGLFCIVVYSLLYFILTCLFVFIFVHVAFLSLLTTQISMRPAGFETATPASDRPLTLALDRSVTGSGRIQTCSPSKRSASDTGLRSLCYWDLLT